MNKKPIHSVLLSSAGLLASRPFETVTISDVARVCGLSKTCFSKYYSSMHQLGAAILTYEGDSMREVQTRIQNEQQDPLKRISLAFRLVGENLATDIIVRAGIRLAGESNHCFPERNINPFRTWKKFLVSNLEEATRHGLIEESIDVESVAWLITVAGLGTKDLLAFTGNWENAPDLLERCAFLALTAVSCETPGVIPR